MNPTNRPTPRATLPLVRCAIYTRKSTEEGLEQEFNSLDAQRESAEAYVRSQAGESWTVLPDRYDDGGFTGGNMDRPALKCLLADVEAGKVDCVIVYKADRLSRSLLDFARILETFEKHHVAFVSVTQQINSATSMGRLMLNVLLSFAQFEREIIGERTRDKIAATRRKGKWSGGRPLLGYDVDPGGQRLSVNAQEAERVRAVYALFLEYESLPRAVRELEARGWCNKLWRTRSGRVSGGEAFTRVGLRRLLTNVLYAGKVRYKDEVHDGEQPPDRGPGRVPAGAGSAPHWRPRRRGAGPRRPGGAAAGSVALRPVQLRHDAGALRQGRAPLPLLHLHPRSRSAAGTLPVEVGPRRRDRAAGAGAHPRRRPRPGVPERSCWPRRGRDDAARGAARRSRGGWSAT